MNQTMIYGALRAYLGVFKEPQGEEMWEATLMLIQGALSQAAVIQFGNQIKEVEGKKYRLHTDVEVEELWSKLLEVSI